MYFKIAILLCVVLVGALSKKPRLYSSDKPSIFKNIYGKIDANIKEGDAGSPLIVTDFLKNNQIKEAQEAAEITSEIFLGVKSYSGYFNIDEKSDANIFFWFFPSQSNNADDPVVLWLQGGPGSTSMFGLFQEHGPFQLVSENQLEKRNTSWSTSNSVLYIDQPVGTGFSFTKGKIPSDQTKVGADLYQVLQQFFQLFPNLQSNDFFITGESYGGKYVPAIGYTILKNNPTADLQINLKGLAIGNGWSSPKHHLRYADYVLQHGLVDLNTRNAMFDLEEKAVNLIENGNYLEAKSVLDEDFGSLYSVFNVNTDFSNVYNYLFEESDGVADKWLDLFLQREDVRKAIHVGNTIFSGGQEVYDTLSEDIPKSVVPWVEELLENYRVLLYSGQLDLIVAYPMTVDYIRSLNFSAADEYKKASRTVWYVEDRIAGFSKTAGKLTEVLVRNAGHMVPSDQPEWSLDLINRFVRNIPFDQN